SSSGGEDSAVDGTSGYADPAETCTEDGGKVKQGSAESLPLVGVKKGPLGHAPMVFDDLPQQVSEITGPIAADSRGASNNHALPKSWANVGGNHSVAQPKDGEQKSWANIVSSSSSKKYL
ncbi:hypothetical protein U1Q18_031492, partial [Sarracenia purpurea var. burkii]